MTRESMPSKIAVLLRGGMLPEAWPPIPPSAGHPGPLAASNVIHAPARGPADPWPKYVTVHVVEAKSPCPTMLQVVRSEPYGRSASLAARDMGAHAASRAGDDLWRRQRRSPSCGRKWRS